MLFLSACRSGGIFTAFNPQEYTVYLAHYIIEYARVGFRHKYTYPAMLIAVSVCTLTFDSGHRVIQAACNQYNTKSIYILTTHAGP